MPTGQPAVGRSLVGGTATSPTRSRGRRAAGDSRHRQPRRGTRRVERVRALRRPGLLGPPSGARGRPAGRALRRDRPRAGPRSPPGAGAAAAGDGSTGPTRDHRWCRRARRSCTATAGICRRESSSIEAGRHQAEGWATRLLRFEGMGPEAAWSFGAGPHPMFEGLAAPEVDAAPAPAVAVAANADGRGGSQSGPGLGDGVDADAAAPGASIRWSDADWPSAADRLARGYPEGRLGRSLAATVDLLRNETGLRIVAIEQAGYDTHVDQGDGRSGVLTHKLDGLARVARRLLDRGRSVRDTTTTIAEVTRSRWWCVSEFGRAIDENDSGGTEHGRGGVALALGDGVVGGVHGDLPSPLARRGVVGQRRRPPGARRCRGQSWLPAVAGWDFPSSVLTKSVAGVVTISVGEIVAAANAGQTPSHSGDTLHEHRRRRRSREVPARLGRRGGLRLQAQAWSQRRDPARDVVDEGRARTGCSTSGSSRIGGSAVGRCPPGAATCATSTSTTSSTTSSRRVA